MKYIILVLMLYMVFCCKSTQKTAQIPDGDQKEKVEKQSTTDTSQVASQKTSNKPDTVTNNQKTSLSFRDSLMAGYTIEIRQSEFVHYITKDDSVPETLQKVFPDVVFLKTLIPGEHRSQSGAVYFNNRQYNLKNHFNILSDKMNYPQEISLQDKTLAAIQLLEGYDKAVKIDKVEPISKKLPNSPFHLNYEIKAIVENEPKNFYMEFRNNHLLIITTNINNQSKSIIPSHGIYLKN